jgi:hypothetical protein
MSELSLNYENVALGQTVGVSIYLADSTANSSSPLFIKNSNTFPTGFVNFVTQLVN